MGQKYQNRATPEDITKMRFELNNLLNSSREKLGKTLYQQIQLADIDLEAYLFVKLSELIEKSKS